MWAHTLKTKKIELQFEKLNRLACMLLTPTRKSISHKSLEVIYDLLPLKLHLEHTAIAAYSRLKDKLTDSDKANSHILHWKTRINDLNIKLVDTDKTMQLNLHNNFTVNTKSFGDNYKQHLMHSQLNIYTDGSKKRGLEPAL